MLLLRLPAGLVETSSEREEASRKHSEMIRQENGDEDTYIKCRRRHDRTAVAQLLSTSSSFKFYFDGKTLANVFRCDDETNVITNIVTNMETK